MIIKKVIQKKKYSNFFNKLLIVYFFISIILISVPILIIFKSATFKTYKVNFLDKISRSGRYNYIHLPEIIYESVKANFSNFEKVNLEISFENILIFENLRTVSLAKGDLPPRHLIPRINLNIIHKDNKYSGDARLKGDRIEHYKDKKTTSYKIELDKNNYLFGMKKFSIQKPIIRNYVHEWIFHELANDFGIIKLKYDFIDLSINGENYGLFVLEEGFGKELIERNNRRSGPIFSLNEDLNYTNIDPVFEIYNKKFWEKKENEPLALIASQKLKDFFNNKIEAKDIFDLDKWASYFAIIDLTGTSHGALLKSVKFYYNPINGLFEPIPFDGHRFKPNYKEFNLSYDNKLIIDFLKNLDDKEERIGLGWLKSFFFIREELNQEFYNLYVSKLNEISSEKFIDDFLSRNIKKIDKINSHIYKDSFWYHNKVSEMGLYYFSIDDFYYQAQNIRNKLNLTGGLQILKIPEKQEFLIKDYRNSYANIIINKLLCARNSEPIEISVNKNINNFKNTIIKNLSIKNDKLTKCSHVKFLDKNNNLSFTQKIDYINSNYNYSTFKNSYLLNYKKYFYQNDKKLFLINDNSIIDENLLIPKGFEVVIKENQKISLINQAFIISDSPWKIGGENYQTLISGEKDNLGGGILIRNTNTKSIINNTKFSYLTGFPLNEISEFVILGAINFYEANVQINNSKFENIYSEDALNIFRSKFEIVNNSYKNVNSDAIDIDFSEGKIRLSNFENIKNDAIDFSGSNATVKNAKFEGVNDKVVSVGEKSNIEIFEINAKNSHVGIVSKDGSFVVSDEINFDNVLIPFAAYQKKKEYDYGSLIVKNYNIKNYYVKWLKDSGSSVEANQQKLNKSSKQILSIINEKNFDALNR